MSTSSVAAPNYSVATLPRVVNPWMIAVAVVMPVTTTGVDELALVPLPN